MLGFAAAKHAAEQQSPAAETVAQAPLVLGDGGGGRGGGGLAVFAGGGGNGDGGLGGMGVAARVACVGNLEHRQAARCLLASSTLHSTLQQHSGTHLFDVGGGEPAAVGGGGLAVLPPLPPSRRASQGVRSAAVHSRLAHPV